MHPAVGWSLIATSVAVGMLSWFGLRGRASDLVMDAGTVLASVGLAAGGLLLLDEANALAWVLTPLIAVIALVAHRRFLFAGDGPLRT
jgi:hypothetical protein